MGVGVAVVVVGGALLLGVVHAQLRLTVAQRGLVGDRDRVRVRVRVRVRMRVRVKGLGLELGVLGLG